MNIAVLAIEACQKATGSKYITCNVSVVKIDDGTCMHKYHFRCGAYGAVSGMMLMPEESHIVVERIIRDMASRMREDNDRIVARNEANDIRWRE